VILALGTVLRLLHLAAVHDAPFVAELAMDSEEYHRWALTIAGGDWWGSEPFFQAPLYPYLLAVVYRLGGGLVAVYLLQILAAVAGGYALYRAGRLLGGEPLGLVAALLHAVYLPFVFYDVQLLKESLAVTLVCLLLWALVAARERSGWLPWLGAGVIVGLVILLRQNMLLVLPLLAALPLLGTRPWRRAWTECAAVVLGAILPLAPIAARNLALGGGVLPTHSGGVNFYIGNNAGADGTYRPIVPGKQVPSLELSEPHRLAEEALGRRLTAAEASRYWLGRGLSWARADPVAFVLLQVRKLGLFWGWYEWPDAVDYYWFKTRSPWLRLPLLEFGGVTGLALVGLFLERGRLRRWLPVLLVVAGWCLSTVVFIVLARYRLPVVPPLLLMAAVALVEVGRSARHGVTRRAATLGLLCCACCVAPHLAGYEPLASLAEYNLGRLAAERGRLAEAEDHFRRALDADPSAFMAALDLGSLAAGRGDIAAARVWFERAVATAPTFDEARASLGGALLASGDTGGAERELGQALALNPANPTALHNLAVLELKRGRVGRARELNRRLLELAPDHAPARRLQRKIERLSQETRRGGD